MNAKKINVITVTILAVTYILSAVFRFLIVKNSPYMYDRFYFTFTAKAVLFLALGIVGYIIASKYGNGIVEKYGWIFGVVGIIVLLCERYCSSVSLFKGLVLLTNPIAIIGIAAFIFTYLKNKIWINWAVSLLPIVMFAFFDNVWRIILIAVFTIMILFAIKEKYQNKGILTLYSLLVLLGAYTVLIYLLPAYSGLSYQMHNNGYMANIISEGFKSAKLFGKASVSADGERQTFMLYHMIMNWGYFAAGIMIALIAALEVTIFMSAHEFKNTAHKFTAYSVFLILLINIAVSLLTNFGIVINGFFTLMPIVSLSFFEAVSVFAMAGIINVRE